MCEGPLWNTVKRQLYRPEVTQVKRLVGEALIQKNITMWAELNALRQIMEDFEHQNDESSEKLKKQMMVCGSHHRDLLRRQAAILAQDIGSQAEACGHTLEDLLPDFRDVALREYLAETRVERCDIGDIGVCGGRPVTAGCRSTPPMTPSTRPPSSSGVSGCSGSDFGLPAFPLGRALGVDELADVAKGIREALNVEQESLLGLISEQMERFEWEASRQASDKKRGRSREPSTSELQMLVRKMQDLSVSPSLRSLVISGSPVHRHGVAPRNEEGAAIAYPENIVGGASVRRLKALIAQRRRDLPAGPLPALGLLRESSSEMGTLVAGVCGTDAPATLDLFFGDPFE